MDELMASRRQIAKIEKSVEELKQVEETLQQKDALFNCLVESSPIAIALLEGFPIKIKFLNSMFTKLFGYTIDDIPNMAHWWSLAYPNKDYRQQLIAAWDRKSIELSNTQVQFKPEERLITCKDGTQKHFEFRTIFLGTSYFTFIVDITKRKQAESESKEKEERFFDLFNRSLDYVYLNDFNGNFLEANPATLDLLRCKREELNSLNLTSLLDKKQRTKALKAIEELKQTGSQGPLSEYILRFKDGRQVYIETKGSVIYKDHRPYAILGIGRDITERKEAEALLSKREEELKVRTLHLEETNTALNVLLRQREKDKNDLEDKIIANIREMVNPYVEKLKSTTLDGMQKTYLNLLKSHLEDITSSFLQTIKSNYLNFTPTEVRVATLIREGKNSKEIGQLINISERTVEFHRNRIRSKLGVNNKKINLRTYLLTLQ